jgi:hypothetical protein
VAAGGEPALPGRLVSRFFAMAALPRPEYMIAIVKLSGEITTMLNRGTLSHARSAAAAAALALMLATTGGAAVAQQTAVQPVTGEAELVTARATVQAVDVAKRQITLKTADGRTQSLKVGSQVQNLAQVKPGDVVKVAFYESIALDLTPPTPGMPGAAVAVDAARAKPHTLPGGEVVESVAITFMIVGIEPQDDTLVVIGPGDIVRTVEVYDPKLQAMLPSLKLGDNIVIVITEGLAVAVEPAAK